MFKIPIDEKSQNLLQNPRIHAGRKPPFVDINVELAQACPVVMDATVAVAVAITMPIPTGVSIWPVARVIHMTFPFLNPFG